MLSLMDLLSSNDSKCPKCMADRPEYMEIGSKKIKMKYNSHLCQSCENVSVLLSRISAKDNNVLVFDGMIYVIGKSKSKKGFGGKKFTIVYKNRQSKATDNLVFYMKVPENVSLDDTCIISPDPMERVEAESYDEEEA